MFFQIGHKKKLKLYAQKSQAFLQLAHFCTRIVDSCGMRFNAHHMQSQLNIRRPQSGNQVQQFECATKLMRTALPDYFQKSTRYRF